MDKGSVEDVNSDSSYDVKAQFEDIVKQEGGKESDDAWHLPNGDIISKEDIDIMRCWSGRLVMYLFRKALRELRSTSTND